MITTKDAFLHPLLYLGSKANQTDEAPRPISFANDSRFHAPVAWVTEEEGKRLIRRAGGLYAWGYKQPKDWLDQIPAEAVAEAPKRRRRTEAA